LGGEGAPRRRCGGASTRASAIARSDEGRAAFVVPTVELAITPASNETTVEATSLRSSRLRAFTFAASASARKP
jgi:hypothetical protein